MIVYLLLSIPLWVAHAQNCPQYDTCSRGWSQWTTCALDVAYIHQDLQEKGIRLPWTYMASTVQSKMMHERDNLDDYLGSMPPLLKPPPASHSKCSSIYCMLDCTVKLNLTVEGDNIVISIHIPHNSAAMNEYKAKPFNVGFIGHNAIVDGMQVRLKLSEGLRVSIRDLNSLGDGKFKYDKKHDFMLVGVVNGSDWLNITVKRSCKADANGQDLNLCDAPFTLAVGDSSGEGKMSDSSFTCNRSKPLLGMSLDEMSLLLEQTLTNEIMQCGKMGKPLPQWNKSGLQAIYQEIVGQPERVSVVVSSSGTGSSSSSSSITIKDGKVVVKGEARGNNTNIIVTPSINNQTNRIIGNEECALIREVLQLDPDFTTAKKMWMNNVLMQLKNPEPKIYDSNWTDISPKPKDESVNREKMCGGGCYRRFRACKDDFASWLDQLVESEPCEQGMHACTVPPMRDNSCNYHFSFPHQSNMSLTGENIELKSLLQKKMYQKWWQVSGTNETQVKCVMRDSLCHCCCAGYEPKNGNGKYPVCIKKGRHPPTKPPSPSPKQGCKRHVGLPVGCDEMQCNALLEWNVESYNNSLHINISIRDTPHLWAAVAFSKTKQPNIDKLRGDMMIVSMQKQDMTQWFGKVTPGEWPPQQTQMFWIVNEYDINDNWTHINLMQNCGKYPSRVVDVCHEQFFITLFVYGKPNENSNLMKPSLGNVYGPVSLKKCFMGLAPRNLPPNYAECESGEFTPFSQCSPMGSKNSSLLFTQSLISMGCQAMPPLAVLMSMQVVQPQNVTVKDSPVQKCGMCSLRVSCCRGAEDWWGQSVVSQICTQHNTPCILENVPGCNYSKLNPTADAIAHYLNGTQQQKERVVGNFMQNFAGRRSRDMTCISQGDKCHCCCSEYVPVVNKHNSTSCVYDPQIKVPQVSCGVGEHLKQCSNGCESTCAKPNPICAEFCSEDLAGCYCKPGYYRNEGRCVPEIECQ